MSACFACQRDCRGLYAHPTVKHDMLYYCPPCRARLPYQPQQQHDQCRFCGKGNTLWTCTQCRNAECLDCLDRLRCIYPDCPPDPFLCLTCEHPEKKIDRHAKRKTEERKRKEKEANKKLKQITQKKRKSKISIDVSCISDKMN